MLVIKKISQIKKALDKARKDGKSIGFVPTMGALHTGHVSLIKKCREENDFVVVSIFVNPTQFGPKEDFKKYPRPINRDKQLAQTSGADILFMPKPKEIYPPNFLTEVYVRDLSKILCGRTRTNHFKGVTTVVAKLLNIVAPNNLYMGAKDFQQAVIIRKMLHDLNFNVNVKICPTIREIDGLAMSSRNSYLSQTQRREAPFLYKTLLEGKKTAFRGEKNIEKIICFIRANILKHTSGKIDYVECVDADTLIPLKKIKGSILIALAVKFGQTRLIDNITFKI